MDTVQSCVPIMEDSIPRDGGLWPEYASTMLICFEGVEDGIPYGNLWSFYYPEPRSFRGLDQLLFTMDALMDEAGQPQAWCEPRQWVTSSAGKKKIKTTKEEPASRKKHTPAYRPEELTVVCGELCTIYVRVYSRQNASMQGIAKNGHESASFRSGLEFMKLMQQALEKAMVYSRSSGISENGAEENEEI